MYRALILLLGACVSARASTSYFIANAGNDANNGTTTGTPWKSFAHVTNGTVAFVSGDSVFLNKGDTWAEQFTMPTNGITLDGYGSGAAPTIDGSPGAKIRYGVLCNGFSNTLTRNLIIQNIGGYSPPNETGACWQSDTFSNRIENCTLNNHYSDDGIAVNGGGTGAVSNCLVINMSDQGFTMHSSGPQTTLFVQSCLISNCNEAFTHSGGPLSQTVSDCVMLDNVAGDVVAPANCVSIFNRCWFKGKATASQYKFSETTSNTTYNYCLFDMSRNTGQSQAQFTVSDGQTYMNNCTFYGGPSQIGAFTVNSTAGLTATNCIFNSLWRVAFITAPGTFALDHCILSSFVITNWTSMMASVSTNAPLFSNAAGADYSLASGAPAIGAGVNVGLSLDLNNKRVGNPPSLGAYEFLTYATNSLVNAVIRNGKM